MTIRKSLSLLCIETATSKCSVAVSGGGMPLAVKEEAGEKVHSRFLTFFIQEAMKKSGLQFDDLDGVVISKGPGSYTGLRIGMMAAKGICYGTGLPLISVNTLKSMASGFLQENKIDSDTLLCPMIDARRMEVYYAVYDKNLNTVHKTRAEILEKDFFKSWSGNKKVCFFGENISKCIPFTEEDPNAIYAGDFLPGAAGMIRIAEEKFHKNLFEDIATYEPFYLKDFIAEHPAFKIDRVLGKKQ